MNIFIQCMHVCMALSKPRIQILCKLAWEIQNKGSHMKEQERKVKAS